MTEQTDEIIYLDYEGSKIYFNFNDGRFDKFKKESGAINNKGVSRGTLSFWAATIDRYDNAKKVERPFLNTEREEILIIFEEKDLKEGQVVQARIDIASSRKYLDRLELFFVFVFDKEGNLGIKFFDTLFKAVRYTRKEYKSEV